jgi:hypothetical protein
MSDEDAQFDAMEAGDLEVACLMPEISGQNGRVPVPVSSASSHSTGDNDNGHAEGGHIEPISFRKYLMYMGVAATLYGVSCFLGFYFISVNNSYYRVGPWKGRTIIGFAADTPGRYAAAVITVWVLQFVHVVLGDSAIAPLGSTLYTVSLSRRVKRRLWKLWTPWKLYLIMILLDFFRGGVGGTLMAFVVNHIDMLFTQQIASLCSNAILLPTKYAPPKMWRKHRRHRRHRK